MGLGVAENEIHKLGQKRSSDALSGVRDDQSLDVHNVFRRGPVPDDSKTNGLCLQTRNEVGVTTIRERGPVLRVAPASHEFVVSGQTFRGHHKRNVVVHSPNEL